jgi:hypothetical protein
MIYSITAVLLFVSIWLFSSSQHFFTLYVVFLFIVSFFILGIQGTFNNSAGSSRTLIILFVTALGGILWLLPGLSVFARIITSVIYLTVLSLFLINFQDTALADDLHLFRILGSVFSDVRLGPVVRERLR